MDVCIICLVLLFVLFFFFRTYAYLGGGECNVMAKYHVMVMTKSWQDSWQVGKLVVGKLVSW